MDDGHTAPDGADAPRRRRLAALAGLVAAVALVAGTVGPPLVGRGVFLTGDTIFYSSPWRSIESPAALDVPDHGPTTDTVDAIYPTRVRFAEHARDGAFLGWDPLAAGGMAVGSESTSGVLGPMAWPYLVLPSWYAPAGAKVLQMAVAIGFTYLFCRRIGAGPFPALFAGLAFAGSGFLVMWTNWQQPEVAALVPALFWAAERHLQRQEVASVVPVAVVLAAMLLGGFPAVAGWALYVLAGYVVVRLVASRDRPRRERLVAAAGVGAGVAAGVLLAAATLLPFAAHLGDLDLSGRDEAPGDSLGVATLVTTVAPHALGLSTEGAEAAWYGVRNQVEGVSFVGATTALAAVAALCLARPRAAPHGARAALVLATVGLGWATFAGGPPLWLLQRLPVFSDNYIGRVRSVLGFTVAALAALGLQALLEREPLADRRARRLAGAALVATAGIGAVVALRARDLAVDAGQADVLRDGLVLPLAIAAAGAVAVAVIRLAPRRAAAVAVVAMTGLLVVESLRLSLPLLPNEDRSLLYPTTPGIDFLAAQAGADRVAPEGFTLFGNAAALYGIRSAAGHTFYATTWKEALEAADPDAFSRSPTYASLRGDPDVMSSAVLDRLGVRWFAATPQHPPPGPREDHGLATATCERPQPLSSPVTVTVPAAGGVRGVVVVTCDPVALPGGATLDVAVRYGGDAATGRLRSTGSVLPAQALALAVPAEDLAGDGDAAITLSLHGASGAPLSLATTPAGDVGLEVVRPADDGLRLAFADDLRIYERTAALPRLRWADRSTVIGDVRHRLGALADGTVPDDTVVLSEPGPTGGDGTSGDAGAGAATTDPTAELTVEADTPTAIELAVDADRAGHVVVADALQAGWAATVDGREAPLVDADHAAVAVAVPAGRHEVALHYRPRGQRVGLAISAVTALGLAVAAGWGRLRRRHRR